MIIKTIVVTPFEQNARILIDESTKKCALVDPGGDLDQIWSAFSWPEDDLTSIVLTHAHLDHVGAVTQFVKRYRAEFGRDVEVIGHRADRVLRETVGESARMFGLSPQLFADCIEPTVYVEEGDVVRIGGLSARVLHVPGHAPGHIALFFPEQELVLRSSAGREERRHAPLAIVGDVLFAQAIGRTDLPGGSYETLIDSIRQKLLTLPDDTIVLAGHGPITTIGDEKRNNPFLHKG